MTQNTTPLSPILASQSRARYHMLRSAGLDFSVQAPAVDEAALQHKLHEAMTPPESMAAALAAAKALSVATRHPSHYVIGADQVLYCNGRIFSKAADLATARENLKYLSGKQHQLISAVCVMQRDKMLWHHADRAKLTMRNLSDAELDHYCARAGDALTRSVGAYELEGLGAWLFDRIEGDHFTILGLPLLPLLGFLREKGYGI
jgi:septum formation protein